MILLLRRSEPLQPCKVTSPDPTLIAVPYEIHVHRAGRDLDNDPALCTAFATKIQTTFGHKAASLDAGHGAAQRRLYWCSIQSVVFASL
jgi:hypothetical protein